MGGTEAQMRLLLGLALAAEAPEASEPPPPLDQPEAVRTPVAGRLEYSFGSSLLI